MSLNDMLENHQNERAISIFDMSTVDDNKELYTFDIVSSDVYCVFFSPEGIASVDGDRSYLTFGYALLTLIYGYYIFKKPTKDNEDTLLNHQTFYNRSLIQFKVLTYLLGSTIVFFLSCIYLAQLNKVGYENTSFTLFIIKLFTLSSGTFFNTWVIYNFLLLASGVFFGVLKDNKRRLFVQIISSLLFFEFLIYNIHESEVYSLLSRQAFFLSNLISYELIILLLLSTYWSWQSYKAINNMIIARKLIVTYILLLLVFLFEFRVHSINVQSYLENKLISNGDMNKWISMTNCSNNLSLVVAALIALIWRDVRYENNEIIQRE
ncbi:unnamed protein product [Ambrosiozyma monospora]|uniref:Unnamed protein product n=1 Tax=Ambrosiozyma monospora TaxID=43982 RepID=A0ACB5T2G8_AMBMO|nr:unnamed protein product [Ambrosiozyma monospora]